MSAISWQLASSPFSGASGPSSRSYGGGGLLNSPPSAGVEPYSNSPLTSSPAMKPTLTLDQPASFPRSDRYYAAITAKDIQDIVDVTSQPAGMRHSSLSSHIATVSDLGITRPLGGLPTSADVRNIKPLGNNGLSHDIRSSETVSNEGLSLDIRSNKTLGSEGLSLDIRSTNPLSFDSRNTKSLGADGQVADIRNSRSYKPDFSSSSSSSPLKIPDMSTGLATPNAQFKPSDSSGKLYYNYNRLSSATGSVRSNLASTSSFGDPSTTVSNIVQPLSDKPTYNTHLKYLFTSKELPPTDSKTFGIGKSEDHRVGSASDYLTSLKSTEQDLKKPDINKNPRPWLGLGSFKSSPPRGTQASDLKPPVIPSSVYSKPSNDSSYSSSSVSSNSGRYLESGVKFHCPLPPRQPFPGRTESLGALQDPSNLTRSPIGGDATVSPGITRSMSAPSHHTFSLNTSPRGDSSPLASLQTSPLNEQSGPRSPLENSLLNSPVGSASKKSILKKVSSYADPSFTRTFTDFQVPLLNGYSGFVNEKLPQLMAKSQSAGSGKRVTFNMACNKSHWYEAPEYPEPYYNPYLL